MGEFVGAENKEFTSSYTGYVVEVCGSTCTVRHEQTGDYEHDIHFERCTVLQKQEGGEIIDYLNDVPLSSVPIHVHVGEKRGKSEREDENGSKVGAGLDEEVEAVAELLG